MSSGRWSVRGQFLSGVRPKLWRRLREESRVHPAYRHRALWLTLHAAKNEALARREERLHGASVAATRLAGPPLVVLGHWGSGTTFLHELLALDPDRFAPSTYQVANPHTFLTTERAFRAAFGWTLRGSRPQDEVPTGFGRPQEDEFALAIATGASPYLGAVFPRDADRYDRFLTLRGVEAAAVERWREALGWLARKLTLAGGRPLVLKSPPHTARIRLLLEVFPDARFVHVHRHPFDTFRSTLNQRRVALGRWHLQPPPADEALVDRVLDHHERMYDAFHEEATGLPDERLHHVTFDALEADPVKTLGRVYEALGLDGFAPLEAVLRGRLPELRRHRKSRHGRLPDGLRARVERRWARAFDAWGYAKGEGVDGR